MLRKIAFQTALFLLAVLLFTALPVSSAEPTEDLTDYDTYYATGAKIAWDAFDRHAGDTHTENDNAIFKTVGSFGDGYLSIRNTQLDFSELFGNDGKTDYTLELTVAMQKSTSGTLHLGALRNFAVGVNNGISATDQHPVDASYGIVSHTYRALNRPSGTRIEFATDVGWKKVHFIGKPLGQVYSFGVSTDYTVGGEDGTDTAILTLFRDAAVAQSGEIAYPVSENTKVYDSSVFIMPTTLNFDYYALRYYERALTEEELRLNHFVDLAKHFSLSLDVYDTYDEETRAALHLALREETFDTVTQSVLQSIVDGFGSHQAALHIDDYITFEGYSAALYGTPALRATFSLDKTALASLEKEGYAVTVGALVAAENGRSAADITLDTQEAAIARTVYANGEIVGTVQEETEEGLRFALTLRYDTEDRDAYYGAPLLFRAFMTLEKDGQSSTYYLDADSDTFGSSVTAEEVSLLLTLLGQAPTPTVKEVLGDKTAAVAEALCEVFCPIFETRGRIEVLSRDMADYLVAAYAERASIMTKTGISGGTYTYANASPYYKLFDQSHAERNAAAHETVTLLLQCENAASIVNFASQTTTKLYEQLTAEQAVFEALPALLTALEENARAVGLATAETAHCKALLTSFLTVHEKVISDTMRDATVLYTNMQAVQKTLAAPTEALGKLRARLFEANDLPAFGTNAPLSSYVILTDAKNKSAALILSSMLLDKFGVFVPYYTPFPASAAYAHTISLFDASSADAARPLGDNDYLLSAQDGNALILGKTTADAQLAAVVFTRSLTDSSITLTEQAGRDIPNLFDTELPIYLERLSVKTAEDGGVLDRFRQVLSEMPDEYRVLQPLSSADYPLSTVNTVYVSPDGNDMGSGTHRTPFKTLARAIDYALGRGGAQILLYGGTYKIDRALTISAIHSGSKQSPLYISAMPGEEVIFTAADTVMGKDFHPVTDESVIARLDTFTENNHENVYVADLGALGITEYGKITTSGEPLFLLDGEQYTLARYPNKKDSLVPLMTSGSILKQSQVSTGASSLYTKHNSTLETEPGWKIRITEQSAYRERIEKWTWTDGANTAESIWLFGALYAEWHRIHYPLVIKNEIVNEETGETDITVASRVNCGWGVLTSSGNNGYFYNILEELDTDGEWYLDHKTGMLYVYASKGIADGARTTIISDTHTLLTLSDTSNVVLNGITFSETLGRGLHIKNCENVLIQNCSFRDTRSNACAIEKSYNTGVITSDFARTSAAMLSVSGTGDRKTMTPDRLFVQNCTFHDPKVQTAISAGGVCCLVSHNRFEDTTVSLGGTECILEYNEFHRGSQITFDSGPIYCSGPFGPKGNHIRYNYLYGINHSLYGIYIDDLSSDNYVYSNVVIYDRVVTSGSKGVNIHNGHQNVVYNNVLVNAKSSGILDNGNYYLKSVYDTSGTQITTSYYRYYTSPSGTQTVTQNAGSGGGLGYRWIPMLKEALASYDKVGALDGRFAERFPNAAIYMELVRAHLALADSDEGYKWETATVAWNPLSRSYAEYPWGEESLYDFLLSHKDTRDIEIYLRSPAYNEYIGNVFIGCSTDIYSYTPWGMQTTNVQNNYGVLAVTDYFEQAMKGDLSKITQSSSWQAHVPGFESIPYERFGRIEVQAPTIVSPIHPEGEQFDTDLPFDELLGQG